MSDVYMVIDTEGHYWTGEEWSPSRAQAKVWPGIDSGFDRAAKVAAHLRSQGFRALPLYVPPRSIQSRRSNSPRSRGKRC